MNNYLQKPILLLMILGAVTFVSCNDDEDGDMTITPNAGTISGGPFNFVVDGTPDNVSGITLDDSDLAGTNTSWVITDDQSNILGTPPTLTDLEGVDFDGAGVGVCFIWHISYEDDLVGFAAGTNTADLTGSFALSNSITVNRNGLDGGTLSGGPFTFVVNGVADNVSGITLDDANVNGSNTTYVITDDANNILGLPPTLTDVEGVDFDGAGAGVCFIWHLTYEDGLTGLEMGMNTADLDGFFGLSNSITVTREALDGGTLDGGPFTFVVNGTADNVSGITLDDSNVNGANTTYVITDDQNNILGLPPTLTDVEGVNFDGAGAGICFIWHLTYEDGITGLAEGTNTSELEGYFDLSNSIMVTREALNGGTISGGPFEFTVDGTPDNVSGITLDDTNVNGSNNTWVITDDQGEILGLPTTLTDVEGVDFDGAGTGVCLIWHLTYEDGIEGLAMGTNTANLEGYFALSNSITVTRN